jgi:hypothetical protein
MSMQSTAYSYSAQEQPKQQSKLQVVGRSKAHAFLRISPRSVALALLAVTIICLLVYNQACLTEISGGINAMNQKISEMESENTRLLSALESTVSLRVIEDQAKNDLGMQRLDKYQTEYIQIYAHDRVEITADAPSGNLFSQVKLTIGGFVRSVQEYIGGW